MARRSFEPSFGRGRRSLHDVIFGTIVVLDAGD